MIVFSNLDIFLEELNFDFQFCGEDTILDLVLKDNFTDNQWK